MSFYFRTKQLDPEERADFFQHFADDAAAEVVLGSPPAEGSIYRNTTSGNLREYKLGAWGDLAGGGGGGGTDQIDYFTPEAVTRGNSFVQLLSQEPLSPTFVEMHVNGRLKNYGTDYTLSGVDNRTVNWLVTASFDIDTGDNVRFTYKY